MAQAQLPATQRNRGSRLAARREHPLRRLQRDFDTLISRLVGGWLAPFDEDLGAMRVWDFDATENGKEIVGRAELPGFEENELSDGETTGVRGERREVAEKPARMS